MGKRDKKQYYSGAAKRAKYGGGNKKMLSDGMRGFLMTCNNRERETVQEAYNIFNEYADRLYGPETGSNRQNPDDTSKESDEKTNGSEVVNDEDVSDCDDIDAALDKEKEQIMKVVNTKKEERRFTKYESGAKNCVFIKTTLQDPCELVSHIVDDVSGKKLNKARYILRLIPVVATCKAFDKNITELVTTHLKKYFPPEEKVSYCIIFKCRNNNQVKQHECINVINSAIRQISTAATIQLDKPQLCFIIEVIRNIFCLGIARDYFEHRKYNLQEMVKEDKEDQEPSKIEENTKAESETVSDKVDIPEQDCEESKVEINLDNSDKKDGVESNGNNETNAEQDIS